MASAAGNDLSLQWFDPSTAVPPKTVLAFFGRRGSGKTTLMRDMLFYIRRHFQDVVVFSATEDCNQTWGDHVPSTFIHYGFDAKKLDALIKRQKVKFAEWKRADAQGRTDVPYPHMLVVCEDLMAEDAKEFIKDKNVRYMFMNGRHAGITLALTVQYLMDLPRGMRGNIDQVFILKENSLGNVERVFETWCGMLCDKIQFKDIVTACTADRGALVVDCTCENNDTMRWYRAPAEGHGPYKIGSRGLWAFHYRYGAGAAGNGAGASGEGRREAEGHGLRPSWPSASAGGAGGRRAAQIGPLRTSSASNRPRVRLQPAGSATAVRTAGARRRAAGERSRTRRRPLRPTSGAISSARRLRRIRH